MGIQWHGESEVASAVVRASGNRNTTKEISYTSVQYFRVRLPTSILSEMEWTTQPREVSITSTLP